MEEAENKENEINPEKPIYHLCIVNLVIGTLYCSKNNYEFGMSRIIKSFDPVHKKLGTDTWYYAKRCFLSLINKMAKNMFLLQDQNLTDILSFLIQCEGAGKTIQTRLDPSDPLRHVNNVAYEARLLRAVFLKLRN